MANKSKILFNQFLQCLEKEVDPDPEVITLMQKYFQKASESFKNTQEFRDLIHRALLKIRTDPHKKYVTLREFTTELKAYCPKREHGRKRQLMDSSEAGTSDDERKLQTASKRLKLSEINKDEVVTSHASGSDDDVITGDYVASDEICVVKVEGPKNKEKEDRTSPMPEVVNGASGSKSNGAIVSDHEHSDSEAVVSGSEQNGKDSDSLSKVKKTTAAAMLKLVPSSVEQPASPNSVNSEEGTSTSKTAKGDVKRGSERQIRKLEILLKEISKEIEELEEQELSVADMGDDESTYTLIDRYKKKFVKVWDKLCEIKGRSATTGRVTERHFHYEGTRYPEINKKIQKFINKHKVFPDFQDIREVIMHCSRKYKLKMSAKLVDGLARDAFTEVGNKLQERRNEDLVSNFGSHLTETFKSHMDPALYDRELRMKLDKNKHVGKSKLEEVINKFANKQLVGDEETSEDEEDEEDEDVLEPSKESDEVKTSPSKERTPTPNPEAIVEESDDAEDEEDGDDSEESDGESGGGAVILHDPVYRRKETCSPYNNCEEDAAPATDLAPTWESLDKKLNSSHVKLTFPELVVSDNEDDNDLVIIGYEAEDKINSTQNAQVSGSTDGGQSVTKVMNRKLEVGVEPSDIVNIDDTFEDISPVKKHQGPMPDLPSPSRLRISLAAKQHAARLISASHHAGVSPTTRNKGTNADKSSNIQPVSSTARDSPVIEVPSTQTQECVDDKSVTSIDSSESQSQILSQRRNSSGPCLKIASYCSLVAPALNDKTWTRRDVSEHHVTSSGHTSDPEPVESSGQPFHLDEDEDVICLSD